MPAPRNENAFWRKSPGMARIMDLRVVRYERCGGGCGDQVSTAGEGCVTKLQADLIVVVTTTLFEGVSGRTAGSFLSPLWGSGVTSRLVLTNRLALL